MTLFRTIIYSCARGTGWQQEEGRKKGRKVSFVTQASSSKVL